MDLRDLRYFVHIAELGNITRAAQQLRVAQPSLTRHIQNLEADLGVAVFTRVNRGVQLTEAGRRLLDRASRILRDVDLTRREVGAQRDVPSGRIALGIPPTLCPVLLPALIARMRRDYPAVDLEIAPAGSMVLPEWLRAGRLDLAVMTEITPSRLLVTTPLVREEMVLVSAPTSGDRTSIGVAKLLNTPVIVSEAIRTITNGLLAPLGASLKVEMVLNSLETIRLMVQEGTCSTILPYSITRRDHMMKLVAVRGLIDGRAQRQLVLATPAGQLSSTAIEATADLIRKIAAEIDADGGFTLTPRAVRPRGNAERRPRRR
jgi:LysR family nitrogen assimilation transcriptional regulator